MKNVLPLTFVALFTQIALAERCPPHNSASLLIPVVEFMNDSHDRVGIQRYASCFHLDAKKLAKKYAPTGIFRCGDVHGAAQLTMTNDVLTTAGHVLYDEDGQLRNNGECSFTLWIDGQALETPIDLSKLLAKDIRVHSKNVYDASTDDDWGVIHLSAPIAQGVVEPYQIAPNDGTEVDAGKIRMVARGHSDWGDMQALSLEDCAAYRQPGKDYSEDRSRNYNLDCSGGDGASGSSVFATEGPNAGKMIGTYEGWRSRTPFKRAAYSASHYNYFTSLEGEFRDAVEALSGQKASSEPLSEVWPPAPKGGASCVETRTASK